MKLSVRFSPGDYLIALGGEGQEGVASVTSNSHRHQTCCMYYNICTLCTDNRSLIQSHVFLPMVVKIFQAQNKDFRSCSQLNLLQNPEAEFMNVEVSEHNLVSSLTRGRFLYTTFTLQTSFKPPLLKEGWGLKLHDYAQKPQRNCTFMSSASSQEDQHAIL